MASRPEKHPTSVGPMQSFDVLVVGAGMAGLTAGLRAAELGRTVAVFESGTSEAYACNTRFSGGVLHVGYQDPTQSADALRELIRSATEGCADQDLSDAVAAHASRTMEWLRQQGAKFIRRSIGKRNGLVLAPPRALNTSLASWEGRGPDNLVKGLGRHLKSRGGEIVLGARAVRLAMTADRCTGIVVQRNGAEEEIAGRAVIIADGGFQSNTDLFRQHIGPRPDLVLQRGAATGRGDGLVMAMAAGAEVTRMDRFYGHLLSRDALHNANLWPYPQIDAVAASGIVVDKEGNRFVDEGRGGIYIANELAKLDDPTCATVIFDTAIWQAAGREGLIPPNPSLVTAGGTLLRAPSMAELAVATGIPAEQLQRTVDTYNASVVADAAADLVPSRTATKSRPQPIATPPFLAIPVCAGITNTMGGIAIDGACRVKAAKGGVIEGLFAAGAATGGIEGGPHVGYVGGLIIASVLGLRAGEEAASQSGAAPLAA